jgi:hypothetical protein
MFASSVIIVSGYKECTDEYIIVHAAITDEEAKDSLLPVAFGIHTLRGYTYTCVP